MKQSKSKKAILFLEPRGSHFEVLRTSLHRGIEPILVTTDSMLLSTLPAHYKEIGASIQKPRVISSWQDLDKLRAIHNQLKEDFEEVGVYGATELSVQAASYLRLENSLNATSPEVYELITNKYRLRTHLRNAGLSNLSVYSSKEVETSLDWTKAVDLVFKPVHGMFSLNVSRIRSKADWQTAKENLSTDTPPEWLEKYMGSSKGYFLEEAFNGELLSIEGISVGGQYHCLGILSRIMFSENPVVEMGSCFPYPHPLAKEIQDFTEKVLDSLNFTDGPSHIEIIVNPNGKMEVIDLNPRFVGADVVQSITFALGIRPQELLCDFALGKLQKGFDIPQPRQFSCLQYFLPAQNEKLKHIEFPKDEAVAFKATLTQIGSSMRASRKQTDYLGCYLTLGRGFEEAINKSKSLREQVRINGTHSPLY